MAAGLVVQDAEEAVAGLEQALDGVRVVEVARGGHRHLLRLEHVGLAIEEVVQGEVVQRLVGGVGQELVKSRAGRGLLLKAGEVDDGHGVSNGVLGSAEALVDALDDKRGEERVQGAGQLVGVAAGARGVEHDRHPLLVDHLRLVAQGGLELGGADAQEGGDNAENILVLDGGGSLGALVGETAAVVARHGGARGGLELELANVQDAGQDLADLGNLAAGELELAQGRLEELEALGVVDADLELGRVAQIPPAALSGAGRVEAQMGLLGGTRAGEEVVEDVEVALARGDVCDPAPLQPVVQQLGADERGDRGGGRVVLQFVEQTRLGGRRGSSRLGGCEGVEDVGGERDLGGQGRRRAVEERGQEVGADGGLA